MKSIFSIILLLICVSGGHAQEDKLLLKAGNEKYNGSSYSEAEEAYRMALESNATSKEGAFNLGDALYRQEKYQDAAQQFRSVAQSADNKEDKAKAYHNLGNSLLKSYENEQDPKKKMEQIKGSVDAYKNALRNNPTDEDTRYNLSYATKLMQQEQQKQENEDENKDEEDKEDQEEQDKNDNKEKEDNQDENEDKKDSEDSDNKDEDEKKDEQDSKDQKDQNDKEDEGEKKPQPTPNKLSKEDAQRLLDALNKEDSDLQQKLNKAKGKRVPIDKEW